MRFPIRYKLLSIIFVILIPLLAFSLYHYQHSIQEEKEEITSDNLHIAKDLAKDIDEVLVQAMATLQVMARHPQVRKKESSGIDLLFAKILRDNPGYLNIIAADMNGNNFGSGISPDQARRLNYLDRQWFLKGREGKPRVCDFHVSKLMKTPAIMVVHPVFDQNLQVGVIGIALALDRISGNIDEARCFPSGSTVNLIDSQGTVLVDPLVPAQVGHRLSDPVVSLVMTNRFGTEEMEGNDGKRRLYSYSSLANADWHVIVAVPVHEAYRGAYSASVTYIVLAFFVALVTFVISSLIGHRISTGIADMMEGVRRIEQGDGAYRIDLGGNDELTDMARAFNGMMDERLRAEKRLKESEAFLNSVLDGIGEGVVVIDRDYRIVSANKGFCNQLKTEESAIIGQPCHKVSHQSDVPCFEGEGCECAVQHCFENGRPYRTIHRHFDNRGKVIYIETNAYPLFDESGKIVSAIETLMDVSDRVMLEGYLQEVTEKYRKLYDDAPDMMHSVDREGKIIICNATEAAVLGYEIEEMIGREFSEFIAADERIHCNEKFERLLRTGSFEGELTLVARDGRQIPVLLKSKVIYDNDGNYVMSDAVLRDITEKKALEAQLLHAQKMEAVGTLAGGIAHDFNNLLTAIIGYGTLVKNEVKSDERLRHNVSQVLAAAERAANLTQSLLAFSRKQPIKPKPVNLNQVVRAVEKLLSRLIGEDIELLIQLCSDDLIIMADTGQLDQILLNLATNARDAMPQGGVLRIETSLLTIGADYVHHHGYGKEGRYAVLAVSDTGTGMDEKTRERVFEPFFTTKEVGKGTGLGLSIVYGIVKQHEGYINVYSEPGKGTAFRIYFPLLEKGEHEARHNGLPDLPRGSETVLIAEDDPEVRELTKAVLKEYGYSVFEAKDGEEALRVFDEHRSEVKLVILDVVMPKKNGREVYEQVRAAVPDMKVIFTSGYTASMIRERGVEEDEFAFISKPFSPSELIRQVHEVLKKG